MPCQDAMEVNSWGLPWVTPPRWNLVHLDLHRFDYLRNSNVVRHWFQRAWQMREAPLEDCFEPFIFTWIALNAWGECVTEQENDADWVRSVAQDQTLGNSFTVHLGGPTGQGARTIANRFRAYWPIPRVQAWRKDRSRRPETKSVHDRARFFAQHHIQCEPKCAL